MKGCVIEMQLRPLKTLSKDKFVSVSTIRQFIKLGLPHYRMRGKILVDSEEYDQWFRQRFRVCPSPSSHCGLDEFLEETLIELDKKID
jgi:hypothetical protein